MKISSVGDDNVSIKHYQKIVENLSNFTEQQNNYIRALLHETEQQKFNYQYLFAEQQESKRQTMELLISQQKSQQQDNKVVIQNLNSSLDNYKEKLRLANEQIKQLNRNLNDQQQQINQLTIKNSRVEAPYISSNTVLTDPRHYPVSSQQTILPTAAFPNYVQQAAASSVSSCVVSSHRFEPANVSAVAPSVSAPVLPSVSSYAGSLVA